MNVSGGCIEAVGKSWVRIYSGAWQVQPSSSFELVLQAISVFLLLPQKSHAQGVCPSDSFVGFADL